MDAHKTTKRFLFISDAHKILAGFFLTHPQKRGDVCEIGHCKQFAFPLFGFIHPVAAVVTNDRQLLI